MNDLERTQMIRVLYNSLSLLDQQAVDIYMDWFREMLSEFPAENYVFAAIALDLVSAERFGDEPQ